MIQIITALLNEKLIDCGGSGYTRDYLKECSAQNKITCPACGGVYEYCHGECVPPYFRHKDKHECDMFPEPETEEHNTGKRNLYEWLLKQSGVTDVVLEGWLPETKQRPDIMFMYDNKRWVIEYQCNPISTEYLNRRDLYDGGGIKSIWVLGVQKYLDYASPAKKNRQKEIEYDNDIYYDPIRNLLFSKNRSFSKAIGNVAYTENMFQCAKCVDAWGVCEIKDKDVLSCCSLDGAVFDGGFALSKETVKRGAAVSRRLGELMREASVSIVSVLRGNGAWVGVDWAADFKLVPSPTGGRRGEAFVSVQSGRDQKICKKLRIVMYYTFIQKKPEWHLLLSIGSRIHSIIFNHHTALIEYINSDLSRRVKSLLNSSIRDYGTKPKETKETIYKKVI